MKVISGKKALITGAASGIGRATAELLAEQGAELYLLDINSALLNSVAQELRQRGAQVTAQTCDLADRSALDACLDDLLQCWGGVDIVVNNAGVVFYGPTDEMSEAQWAQLLAVNLLAPAQIIRRLLPSLLERGEGQIVNVCSLAGLAAFRGLSAYSLTKYGLLGFSESLRSELARYGIGVSAICPGYVTSEMHKSAMRADGNVGMRLPSRWVSTSPEAVARCIVAAICKNRFLTVITPFAKLVWLIKRLTPSIWPVLAAGFRRRIRKKSSPSADAASTPAARPRSRAA
jgi:short-subunit dehydrogenase